MSKEKTGTEESNWRCRRCNLDLVVGPVSVSYMGSRFTTDLPHCPSCGMVFVSEEVALGKMADVERILEDK